MATILVIDDDPQLVRLLEISLKGAGYDVLKASDGETGLSITKNEQPDLVIADVMMPKINGYDYCRRVRAEEDLADIPILIFSARFQPIDQQTAMQAGATDYLPKTVAPADLLARIESLLGTSPSAAEIKSGSVVPVFSLRGGVGVTTLAVNLSVAVSLSRQQSVALIDMAPVAGHAALMLNLRPGAGLRRGLGPAQPINVETLQPHWQTHAVGVQVLSSSLSLDGAGEVSPAMVQPLAAFLRREFPLALLDVPSRLSGTTAAALGAADRILLVVTPDVASLQSAAIALQALTGMGVLEERIWTVINRPGGVGGLSVDVITRTLRLAPVADIPYEPGMLGALNARRPIMLSGPNSAAAQAIARLAGQLMAA